jgi:cell pole-organizing protein PopZ
MEEIIASISRIITEDKRPSEPVGPVAEDKSDILELTEAVDEDGSVRHVTRAVDNPRAISIGSGGAVDSVAADSAAPIKPEAPQMDNETQAKPEPGRERILSSATSGAAAAAFAQLGALPRERRREGDLPLGGADRTLEDVVREILRPLLQTWLDEHLPGIVERLVRDEIARVVGEAGLR